MSRGLSRTLLLLTVLLAVLQLPNLSIADDASATSEASVPVAGEDIEVSEEGEELDVVDDVSSQSYTEFVTNESEDVAFSSHPHVHTHVIFPNHADKVFEIGSEVSALISFANTGSKTFNLTYAGANLLSPYDDTHYIQNFTIQPISQIVYPGHEVSVNYVFTPHESLDPATFKLNAWIVYNSTEGRVYANTYYNSTIELIAPRTNFLEAKNLLTLLILLSSTGAFIYWLVSASSLSGKKLKKRGAKPNPEKAKQVQQEWEAQVYVPRKQAKPVGSKKHQRSQKKDSNLTNQQ